MIPTRSLTDSLHRSVNRSVNRVGPATNSTDSHERTDGLTETWVVQMRDRAAESNAHEIGTEIEVSA